MLAANRRPKGFTLDLGGNGCRRPRPGRSPNRHGRASVSGRECCLCRRLRRDDHQRLVAGKPRLDGLRHTLADNGGASKPALPSSANPGWPRLAPRTREDGFAATAADLTGKPDPPRFEARAAGVKAGLRGGFRVANPRGAALPAASAALRLNPQVPTALGRGAFPVTDGNPQLAPDMVLRRTTVRAGARRPALIAPVASVCPSQPGHIIESALVPSVEMTSGAAGKQAPPAASPTSFGGVSQTGPPDSKHSHEHPQEEQQHGAN